MGIKNHTVDMTGGVLTLLRIGDTYKIVIHNESIRYSMIMFITNDWQKANSIYAELASSLEKLNHL